MVPHLHKVQPSRQIPAMKVVEVQVRNQGEEVVACDDEAAVDEDVEEAGSVLESYLQGVQLQVVAKEVPLEVVGCRRAAWLQGVVGLLG